MSANYNQGDFSINNGKYSLLSLFRRVNVFSLEFSH